MKKHHLFLEVDQFFNHQKKISTSSFYNSLTKMNKLGLIEEIPGTGKKSEIKASDTTYEILDMMSNFLISSTMDMTEIEIDFIGEIEKRIKMKSLGEVLVLDTSKYIDLHLIEYLKDRAKTISILSLDENRQDLLIDENIYTTQMRNDIIREPDASFRSIIIPVYLQKLFRNTNLLAETYRILKPDGVMIITALSQFQSNENYFINSLLEKFKRILNYRLVSKDDLEDELMIVNPKKVEIFDHHGMMIGILWK